jgi:hypothetical protein
MTIYAPTVANERFSPEAQETVRDVPVVDEAHACRDREVTMAERLARAHQLCAQLATLQPVDRKPRA